MIFNSSAKMTLNVLHLCILLNFVSIFAIDVTEENVEATTSFITTTTGMQVSENKTAKSLTDNTTDIITLQQSPSQGFHAKSPTPPMLRDFRPSQHLETYIEFNRSPVPPAYPEAKTFHSSVAGGNSGPSIFSEQPLVGAARSSLKFPTTKPVTAKDQPYPFYMENNSKVLVGTGAGYQAQAPPKPGGLGAFESMMSTGKQFSSSGKYPTVMYAEPWVKYEKDQLFKKAPAKAAFDEDFGAYHHGIHHVPQHGHVEHPLVATAPHSGTGLHAVSPWKKIIKILTAFIPIGLLISALTPSVITISPMAMGRARMDGSNSSAVLTPNSTEKKPEVKNDNGCEDRVLCELLLNAGYSDNSQANIGHLVQAYTDKAQNVADKTEKLRKIFKSIRNESCDAFVCASIDKKIKN